MQVSPHVMARPGELRMAEWSEFDLDNAVWKIPAERMKMRRPHEVPLSRQVLAYLEELFALTGPDGYVFPTLHTSRRPLSENTVNQSLRRVGYAVGEVTAHGLERKSVVEGKSVAVRVSFGGPSILKKKKIKK